MHLFARIQMRRAAGPFSLAPYPALVPFALLRTNRRARTLVRSSHGRLTRAHAKNVHAARRDTDSSTLRPKTFVVFPPPFFSPRSKLSSDRNAPINRPSIRVVSKFFAVLGNRALLSEIQSIFDRDPRPAISPSRRENRPTDFDLRFTATDRLNVFYAIDDCKIDRYVTLPM